MHKAIICKAREVGKGRKEGGKRRGGREQKGSGGC